MHEVVSAAVDICRADFDAKHQELNVHLEAGRHQVQGDTTRLQQVVWNILKNAAKFTPAGGRIEVRSSNRGERFVLTVTDNGMGIGPDGLPHIFDAFVQEGSWVTSEFGGLGLGLAIAKSTIEAHDGDLKATSAGRGKGATFTIELPATTV